MNWGPRTISQTVQYILIVLRGSYYWFTWAYSPGWRCKSFLYSTTVPRASLMGTFLLDNPAQSFDRVKSFSQKISVATLWTIISLEIRLKDLATRTDLTRSLTFRLNRSISGTCSSWVCNFGICRDHPSLLVEVINHYQSVYVWFWSHVAGISCGQGSIVCENI